MTSRLQTALHDHGVVLPEDGRILVLRCPASLAPDLPLDRCDVVHGFAPVHSAWRAAGAMMRDALDSGYAASIVTCPRGRDHARTLVAEALAATRPGGLVMIDGQKTDGIEPLLKALRSLLPGLEVLSKAHGKLIWAARPADLDPQFADWAALRPTAPDGWVTAQGAFSAEAVDPGSALLVAHLPVLKGTVCDLGAGWGYIARAVLAAPKVTRLDLVEAEQAALQAAQINITDPRAAFHWADAMEFGTAASYDVVVTNPPFHTDRAATPALGQAFLTRARTLLKRGGTLALVANRHLPYERTLSAGFGHVQTVADERGFKVIHATHPLTAR